MSRLNPTSDLSAETVSLFDFTASSAIADPNLEVRPDHSVVKEEEAVNEQHQSTSNPQACSSDPIDQTGTINSSNNSSTFFNPVICDSHSAISLDTTTSYPSTSSSLCLKSSRVFPPNIKLINEANQQMSQLRDMTLKLKRTENKKCGRAVLANYSNDIDQLVLRRIALESANGRELVNKLTTVSLSEYVKLLEMIAHDYVQLNKLIVQHSSV
ncbi:hypothetical protein M3Y96_00433400 [Aphelenchoides besseyi]|nr:hypothetical protein M3Y96_00433400 [Aphelenchoides besseyi]